MKRYLLFILVLACLFGCSPRNLNMLQGNLDSIKAKNLQYPTLSIQKGDLLFVGVNSRDPQSDIRYNMNNYYSPMSQSTSSASNLLGYLVDQSGNISIADVGTIKAEGLQTKELAEIIQDSLKTYLRDPSVAVRFLNFKITVLGEVSRPGTFQVPTEKVSIIEALGLAGDVTVYGQKEQVMVIREANGGREYGMIDLTKGDMFKSPYFYLQQNDAVYVYINKKKAINSDQSLLRNVSIATGIISTVAIIITALK